MYAPYPENMMESIKKVEATRAERMATEPKRLTAEEKDALLKKFHPDYNPDAFAEIKVGPNKGQKAPLELAEMLHSTSRLMGEKIDLTKIDYDVDVLVIGGGGAGSSCAIEAHNAGANVMLIFGPQILQIFISKKEVQAEAVLGIAYRYLAVMAATLVILYLLHIYRSALQGMGDTVMPMFSGIAELTMRILIALLLPLLIGKSGIYFAETGAWTGALIILLPSYYRRIRKLYLRKR